MYVKLLKNLSNIPLVFGPILSHKPFGRPLGNTNYWNQATAAFGIATIVLGVDNADLKTQLDEILLTTTRRPNSTTTKTTTTTTTPRPTPPITTPTSPPPLTTSPSPPEMSKYRLPTTAAPKSYDLYLYPNLMSGSFKGLVDASTTITTTTKEVVLHSNKLTITRVFVDQQDGVFEVDEDYERLIVRKKDDSDFVQGDVVIKIEFKGDMRNRIVGLYSSSYKNSAGDVRYMATSKFEPTYARQAFPCFDEPNLKATYKVHLLKPNDPDYIALSNNPQINEEIVPEGIMVHFEETVPMSTYLSCFIVSDFQHTDTTFENNGVDIPFRVYASPDQLEKTTYAGHVGKTVIEYYITYFNISYPLPKLDMVAIPDFVSGAMEHWGLVTYRETALLYESNTHSASNKQRVAVVVAHELAHSWFGNLVTMDWWNNLWLNEGFATYIADKGVNAVHPEWQMFDQFLITTLHSILSLDATQGSHPIIQTVQTPDQITEVFDSVSYDKGASVLRMLENVVGSQAFQDGVTNYLNAHKFGNAVTQDLWDEIQVVVGEDKLNVTQFMDTFTIQMGYPVVSVKLDGNQYVLTQKRFLKDYSTISQQPSSPLGYKWQIPVTYITDLGPSEDIHWFDPKSPELKIDIPDGIRWIKFNPGQIGYYRVNYADEIWASLADNIEKLALSDKTHLLEESFSIAESGDLSYRIPLTLTTFLRNETHYILWSAASSQLQKISRYLQNSQYDSDFKSYVIGLLTPAYDELTWEDEDDSEEHLVKLARVTILNLACVVDHQAALDEAKERFESWIANTATPISPNLRTLIYKFGMVNADEATWSKLFDIFAEESDANEKLKLMNGLANVRNPSLLTKLIELAKDETYVRSQDYFTLLQYIAANPVGAPIVWDYVRENWGVLVERFGLNDRYLGRLIPSITGRFSTKIKLQEMQQFFANNPEAGAGAAARKQALETVNNNIKWLQNHREDVENWIVENRE